MNSSLKILSSPTINWLGNLTFADTRETSSPVVLTYATYDFYNADSNPGAKVVLLNLDGKYALRRPIMVTLNEENNGEYIACFEEAMLSRSGETAREAIDWLRSSIVTLYDLLKEKDPKKLGPLPSRQLKVLGNYLVAEPNPKA
jgi:hypothetical protein